MADSIAYGGLSYKRQIMQGTAALPIDDGGAVPVVSAVSYGVVDLAGGGERVVVTVDSSTGCTTIAAGGVNFTSFAIDDGTHVSGIPGAHAAGVVDVVVTNATGPSTTGTGLIEYFAPHDLSPTCELLPGDYAVVGTQGVDAVGTWTDSSGNANHAVSGGGVNSPLADGDGNPDFTGAANIYLNITQSMASSYGSPPDMATLGAGTQIAFFEGDVAMTPDTSYLDAGVAVGRGASAGICFNTNGVQWEAYDEGAFAYRRTAAVAAATGVKHFCAGRWNGSTWGCFVNGSAEQTVTADASVLSDGNVGTTTFLGATFAWSAFFDGRMRCFLMFATAISNANIAKIRAWGQQRGIAA